MWSWCEYSVAGIGNIFQGDDAFGCEVAKALRKACAPDNVRVVDFGIRGLDLTYALLDKPDLTILLDATQHGGEPGTFIQWSRSWRAFLSTERPRMDAHSMDPVHVLRTVKAHGRGTGTHFAGRL